MGTTITQRSTAVIQLTMSDVCEISGYTRKQIRAMYESGVLIPERSGSGPGCFRLYGVTQCVGLCYAAQWGALGHSRELVVKVLDFVLDYTEEELVAEFVKGRRHLIPRVDGPMKLVRWLTEDDDGGAFNLEAVYDGVKEMLDKWIAEGHAVPSGEDGRGRRRGVAMMSGNNNA